MDPLLLAVRKRLLEGTISPADFNFKWPEQRLWNVLDQEDDPTFHISSSFNSVRAQIKECNLNNFFSRYSSFVKTFYPFYFSNNGEYREIVKKIICQLEVNFNLIYTNLIKCFASTDARDECFSIISGGGLYSPYPWERKNRYLGYAIANPYLKDNIKKYFQPVNFEDKLTSKNLLTAIELFYPGGSDRYYLDVKRLEEIEADTSQQKINPDINTLMAEIASIKEENQKLRDYIKQRLPQ